MSGKKNNWKNMTVAEKILWVVGMAVAVAVIVLSVLQLLDVTNVEIKNWSLPLMGVLMILQCAREWKKNRSIAIFSLGAAAMIFVCAGVVIFLK